jgi:lysosomal acid lipase/cholesteryl ester hydrolase
MEEFFDYSFYKLGQYDIPAMIDYVRNSTHQDKVSYIAHSMGTTQMFVSLAENFGNIPDKLNVFVALAPVTRIDGVDN